MKELVVIEAGDVEVDKSIVVVVAGGDSHRIANALQAGLFRYIRERSVPIVAAVGGWQVSGTVLLSTGNPFTVYADQNTYALAGSVFPNWNPGVNWKPAHQTIENWYNPGAFLRPADGTFGNVRRNSLYGPGLNVFNMSAAKSFTVPFREGIRFEFRADAQNVFNHPSFGVPSTGLGGSAGPGTPYTNQTAISWTTVGGRNLQLGLRASF